MPDDEEPRTARARRLGIDLSSPFLDVLVARSRGAGAQSSRPVGTAVERVTAAADSIRRGGLVLLVRPVGGLDQGHLVLSAAAATPANLSFVLDHSAGLLGVALPSSRCAALALPPMVADDTGTDSVVFAVSVDATAATTGTSVADRCRTVHALAAAATTPGDLRRPGHVFPLIARDGGVLDGGGPAEAAVDLVRLAGQPAAAVVCDVVLTAEGAAARAEELDALAHRHRIPVLRLEDLLVHARLHQGVVRVGAATNLPTPFGQFTAELVVSEVDATEVLVLRMGDLTSPPHGTERAPLIGVHVECLLGDALGSLRCDCSERLESVLSAIADEGRGALLYLREGSRHGGGLLTALSRYAAQDAPGREDDEPAPHLPPVIPDAAADALHLLGAREVRFASDDPAAVEAIQRLGMVVHPV